MFEGLNSIDKSWLLAINGAHTPWWDAVFWQISQAATWLPLYALLIICMFVTLRGQRTAVDLGLLPVHSIPTIVFALLMIAIAVGGSDLICAQLIKPLVARPRPTHDAEIGALIHVVNNYRGGMYGFCSNHAANTMACAVLCSAIFTHGKSWHAHLYITLPLMLWVLLNCYSRMYLGVHYPLDIAAGLVVGGVMAAVVWVLGRDCLYPRDAHEHPADEELPADVQTVED